MRSSHLDTKPTGLKVLKLSIRDKETQEKGEVILFKSLIRSDYILTLPLIGNIKEKKILSSVDVEISKEINRKTKETIISFSSRSLEKLIDVVYDFCKINNYLEKTDEELFEEKSQFQETSDFDNDDINLFSELEDDLDRQKEKEKERRKNNKRDRFIQYYRTTKVESFESLEIWSKIVSIDKVETWVNEYKYYLTVVELGNQDIVKYNSLLVTLDAIDSNYDSKLLEDYKEVITEVLSNKDPIFKEVSLYIKSEKAYELDKSKIKVLEDYLREKLSKCKEVYYSNVWNILWKDYRRSGENSYSPSEIYAILKKLNREGNNYSIKLLFDQTNESTSNIEYCSYRGSYEYPGLVYVIDNETTLSLQKFLEMTEDVRTELFMSWKSGKLQLDWTLPLQVVSERWSSYSYRITNITFNEDVIYLHTSWTHVPIF